MAHGLQTGLWCCARSFEQVSRRIEGFGMRHGKHTGSRWGTALAVAILAGCAAGADADARLAKSDDLIAKGEYGAALLEIKNAVQEKPADASAQLALARISLLLNNTGAARKALDASQAHGADAEKVSRLRIQLLQQEGAHDELIKLLDSKSLTLAAPLRDVARAQALTVAHQCPAAIDVARNLLTNPDTLVAARIVLAECYAQAGQRKLALELLDATARLQPTNAEAWMALGRMQQLSGLNSEAETSWTKAGEQAAGQLTALQQLNMEVAVGDLQLARNELPAARATHGRMLRIAPQGGLTALFEARLLLAAGDQEAAVTALRELVNNTTGFEAARLALVSALLAGDAREQALTEILKLAQEFPKANNINSAARLLKSVSTTKPDNPDYWLAVAGTQILLGQPAMARLALEKGGTIVPDSPKVARMLVELELRSGNGSHALKLAQALVERYPADPSALSLLAQAQRAQNLLPEAFGTLSKLQARQPTAETAAQMFAVQREVEPATALMPLRAWLAEHPDAQQLRALLADSLLHSGKNKDAISEYEKLVVAAPTNVPALNNLAWLYYLEKDERAVETARKAWQLAPKSATVADTYGWLLLESGATKEGLAILEGADKTMGLIDPENRYHLAAALARAGRNAEAREHLASLLREAPQFPSREAANTLASSIQ
jgi:Tfp pilus assembly protein PilF